MIDLHTHSRASDGSFTPTELVDKAHASGISAIALTDHDSMAGLAEAEARSKALGIRFVRGVEIEISFAPGEFHLLGLDFNADYGPLADAALRLAQSRDERNRSVFDLLALAGMEENYDSFLEENGGGMIGRPHIANLMVKRKFAKSKQDAFDRFLAKGRPFYAPKTCLQLSDAIQLIHESGGFAIVAHPLSLFVSWTRMKNLMAEWAEIGIDGIEAWHPIAKPKHCLRLETMGLEHGFRISAGSDYHGPTRPERRLGYTAGDKPIGEEFLAAIAR